MKKVVSILTTMFVMLGVIAPSAMAYNNNYYGNGYGYNNYGHYPYEADQYVYSGTSYSYSSITGINYVSTAATRFEIVKHYVALINGGNYYNNYNYYGNGYNNNYYNNNYYNGYYDGYGYNNYGYNHNNYNNYGYNYQYLMNFADYNNLLYSYTADELAVMDEAARTGLLRGIEDGGRNYAAPERNVTRAQYAAFTNRAMQQSGVSTYGYYQQYRFNDVPNNHWAYNDISAMVSTGIMNGYNYNYFGTEDPFKSEDALITYYRLFVEQSYRYTYENFADVINGVGYWWLECNGSNGGSYMNLELADMYVGERYTVRVTTNIPGFYNQRANWRSSNTSVATVDEYGNVTARNVGTTTITATCNGISGSRQLRVLSNGDSGDAYTSWRFTKSTHYMNVGDVLYLSSVMDSYPSGISFNVSGNGITLSNGAVTANREGSYTVTGNAYGITDTLNIVVQSNGSSYPVVTQAPTELMFDQSTLTVQRGESVNLYDHLVNKISGVSFTSADNSRVSISGNTAYANAVTTTPVTVTAYSGSYSATIRINVVDNNAAENLTGIRVNYSNFNTTGSCNVTVTGIPAGYTVKINNGDYQASYIEKASTSSAVQLQVTGLYPEGGRDALIVCVYNAQGVQVWEDPNGPFCPQTNSYLR